MLLERGLRQITVCGRTMAIFFGFCVAVNPVYTHCVSFRRVGWVISGCGVNIRVRPTAYVLILFGIRPLRVFRVENPSLWGFKGIHPLDDFALSWL